MTRIRVLLVVEDYYSRYALHAFLSKDLRTTVIDEVRGVEEANWLLEASGKAVLPDAILFDADLRDTPEEALERLVEFLQEKKLRSKVLCCVTHVTLKFIRSAVEIGVDGILTKEEVGSRVADAIAKARDGVFVYTKSVSDKAFGRIQGVSHSESYMVPPPRPSPLDHKLRRVARLYCENGLTAGEIAEILHMSEAGVRAQIQQIYRTLGVNGKREVWHRLIEIESDG